MAEENTLEWMTEQRDRLKVENDKLNPYLDAANARLETQALKLSDLTRQLTEKQNELTLKSSIIEGLQQQVQSITTRVEFCITSTDQLSEKLRETQAQLADSESLSIQRRVALADVMKVVSTILEKVMPLLAE